MHSEPDSNNVGTLGPCKKKRLGKAFRRDMTTLAALATILAALATIVVAGPAIGNLFAPSRSQGHSSQHPTTAPTGMVPRSTTQVTSGPSQGPTATPIPDPAPTLTPPATATLIPPPTATPSASYFDAEFPDNNTPQTVQGPAIVEWAATQCGIFELDQGQSFTWSNAGHYWLYYNQQSLDAAYPAHRSQYFQKPGNANCIEGAP